MTRCEFFTENDRITGFSISGHSGYAEAGQDIVCAAVSAMAMLTINTISDSFGLETEVTADENGPVIDFKLKTENRYASALISGLANELSALENDYPNYVRVIIN